MRKPRSKEWEADLDPFGRGRPGAYAVSRTIDAIHGKARHDEREAHRHGRPGSFAATRAIEAIDAEAEHQYWRRHYANESYCEPGAPFERYELAYQIGYEGRERYPVHAFEEVERELAAEYARRAHADDPPWAEVSAAARAAWDRCTQRGTARG